MIPKVYIHLKTGNEYLVLHRGVVNAQNGERMVLYTLYVHSPRHEHWYVLLEGQFDLEFKEKENG
jgi:hypothetical protein